MTEAKILTRHPQGKRGVNIDKKKYETLKRAMLATLRRGERTHGELIEALKEKLGGKFDGNVSWYAETVKLDLEARKEIERTKSRPQRYRIR